MNQQYKEWIEACSILGFNTRKIQSNDNEYVCKQTLPDGMVVTSTYFDGGTYPYTIRTFTDGIWCTTNHAASVLQMIKCVDRIHSKHDYNILAGAILEDSGTMKSAISAAVNTRDLVKQMVRVKSSNVWAIGMNIRNRKDQFGDVLAQFKGPKGGPGDIYIYYDVPIRVYRRWQSAPSKGHYLWQYLRNNYKYSKLTGDKRGKLKNAVN